VKERVSLLDDRERAVVRLWRKSRLAHGTVRNYLYWVRRFRRSCENRKLREPEELTAAGVERFLQAYTGPRLQGQTSAQNSRTLANNALHAWACALSALDVTLPLWREKQAPLLTPLLHEYRQYRRVHNGISEGTLRRDLETAQGFLQQLSLGMNAIERATVTEVDAFVRTLAARLARRTVADACSSLRAFLRFLHITGRLPLDLAREGVAPRYRIDERPPRTLPWGDVQKILQAIPRSEAPGKRDFAILLLLATYGLGAAEVLTLQLQNIDWKAGILRTCRPKTQVPIELPLLPAVAQALVAYLQAERPPARSRPQLFLRKNMPYEPITSGAMRHRIRYYARLAGVSAEVIGAHAFRHSHASRQIDAGANVKVVSEILGHRSSSSTSIYVRVAFQRLRTIGLPVPR